jgi:phosphomannomutase/phosphoglucomutase
MAKDGRALGDLLSDLPPVISTPEIRIDCPDELKFRVVKDAAQIIARSALEVTDIDGIRALFDGGWGLLRASNTQPVLVSRFEGRDTETVLRIRAVIEDAVACVRGNAGA